MTVEARFDAALRARCALEHAARGEVSWMVSRHYLGRWPGVVVCTLVLRLDGIGVGTAVFALPPRETATRYGGVCWELARLWVEDSMPRNTETWCIGKALRHVRREHPNVLFLVSYADPSAGHSGVIYRASNWLYDGRTDAGRKTPRKDYRCGGKMYSRMAHLPPGEPYTLVPRVSKYRYVYPLHRQRPLTHPMKETP